MGWMLWGWLAVFAGGDPAPAVAETDPTIEVCLRPEEQRLVALIRAERAAAGLGDIPLSRRLTRVAQAHVLDLYDHRPDRPGACNLHSWSRQGTWTACCYTDDHRAAECLWSKPRELTGYPGSGYEIASASDDPDRILGAGDAMEAWRGSRPHADVLLNRRAWKRPWAAMGVGMYRGYAVVWFGHEPDADGPPGTCLDLPPRPVSP
jgi:hypothetical protein